MTINYTTLLGLAQPVTGTETGQWGDVVNDEITSLLEDAVANAATFSVTSGNVTLTTTNGASNQARMSTLIITGSPGATRNVIAPSQAKVYQVINQSDSSVVIKGSATTGVTIAAGATGTVVWNGSDFVEVNSTSSGRIIKGNLQVTGNLQVDGNTQLGNSTSDTLAVTALINSNLLFTDNTYDIGASGATRPRSLFLGTNLTVGSLTSTRVPYASTGGLLVDSANMTFNGTRLTVADLADSSLTSGRVTYATTGGNLTDSANLTFDGTDLRLGSGANQNTLYINAGATGGAIIGQRASSNAWFVGDTAAAFGSGTGLTNYVYGNVPFIWYSQGVAAELMRLNGTGLAIGTQTPSAGAKLTVAGASSTSSIVRLFNNAQSTGQVELGQGFASGSDNIGYLFNFSNAAFVFGTNGTERGRVSAAGSWGFGTTDTSNGRINVLAGTGSTGNSLFLTNVDGVYNPYVQFQHNGIDGVTLLSSSSYGGTASNFTINIAGSPTVTFNGSANTGLRCTPSAWSGNTVLELFNPASAIRGDVYQGAVGGNNVTGLSHNAYWDGSNWKTIYTAANYYASRYEQTSGLHAWYTAGLTNGTISFTQAMTLTLGGNLGIGTASPTLNSTGKTVHIHAGSGEWALFHATTGESGAGGGDGTVIGQIGLDGYLFNYEAGNLIFGTSGGEKGRFNGAGEFLLGSTAEGGRITISGSAGFGGTGISLYETSTGDNKRLRLFQDSTGVIYNATYSSSNNSHIFQIGNGEALRINPDRRLLVGTTSAVIAGRSVRMALSYVGGNTEYGLAFAPVQDNAEALSFANAANSLIGNIFLSSTGTAYNTSSDYRLKNITGKIANSGAYIDALNPVEGTWKSDGSVFVGLLAHEAQEVSRTRVATGEKDGEQMQSMDYSSPEIIANLIAEVQSLRRRLAAANL